MFGHGVPFRCLSLNATTRTLAVARRPRRHRGGGGRSEGHRERAWSLGALEPWVVDGDRTGFTEKTMVVSEVMGIPKNHRFQYFNTQV